MDEIQELRSIFGDDVVNKLISHFGGQSIYIPKKIIGLRNEEIKNKFDTMLCTGQTCMNSYTEISKEYDLSVRMIQKICNSR